MAELTGIPIPAMNWQAPNVPETFRKFKQTCEFIFDGPLSEKDEVIKIQYLMLWVGEEGMDIREGWRLTEEQKKSLNIHWEKFESHVKPKSCFRVARFQLRALKQNEQESIDSFITRAKVIASRCEYTNIDEQLLDTLVSGVKNETVQRKLVSKDKNLTLDEALTIVRSFETTEAQFNEIQETRKINTVNMNRRFTPRKQGELRRGQCWNCGGGHPREVKCPAYGSTCDKCEKPNHWAKVCLSFPSNKNTHQNLKSEHKQSRPNQRNNVRHGENRNVHTVMDIENKDSTIQQDDNEDNTQDFFLDSIDIDTDTTPSDIHSIHMDQAFTEIQMSGELGPISVPCKIDTGAQANVMPRQTYLQLFPGRANSSGGIDGLKQSNISLTAYGGSRIQQYGIVTLSCSHKGEYTEIKFHITEARGPVILGLQSCLHMSLVTLQCHEIQGNNQDNEAKESLLKRFPDTFKGVGLFPGEYHIQLKPDAEPVIQPPRRVPEALKEPLKIELQRMVDLDIIEKVDIPTDWVSSLVYVTKPNGDLRICLDPKDLNKWVKREHHYTPTVDDILPKLSNAKVFSKLDARSGYWNIKLDPESKYLTTFNTPYGRYCFKRLPFGLNSSQDVFQKRVDQTFEGLAGVIGIADDIIVYGNDEAEHDKNLNGMMNRTIEAGLKLNPDKCDIKKDKIKFYGHYVTATGLKPDPDKITAILKMDPPSSVDQLQSLLGMANYLGRFTPGLSTITAPLRDLMKKDSEFMWYPEHAQAFEKLKSAISSSSSLAYFDPNSPTTVQVDASKRGLGAVLLQNERPVAFASKSLTDTEANYSNIEREMLAIVFGLERFHHYVYGRMVTIESDHKPLEAITKKHLKNAPPRLMRMLLRSQQYTYTVKYKPGKDVPIADALSRTPIPGAKIPHMDITVHELVNVSMPRLEQIKKNIINDPQLMQLKSTVVSGWPDQRKLCHPLITDFWNYRDEISVHDGVIVKGDRVIIPAEMRPQVLEQIHTGHQGIEKCRLRARESVYWHGINADIERIVKSCSVCQKNQTSQQKEPLVPIEAEKPWNIVGSDLFTWHHNNYLLMVDYYSGFPIIRKLSTITAYSVITAMKSVLSEYGIPNTLITDNGSQYVCSEFRSFSGKYGFNHQTSSPHYHQANGKAERYVGITKKTFQKALESNQDPDMAMLCVRTSPLGPNLPSPAELMFNRKVNSNLPFTKGEKSPHEQNTEKLQNLRQKQTEYYNRQSKLHSQLHDGQSVRIQDPITKKWDPAIVRNKCTEPRSYIVEGQSGGVYRRNRIHIRTTGETFTEQEPDPDENIKSQEMNNEPVQLLEPNNHPAPEMGGYQTRSGRSVKPPTKLDL